MRNCSCGLWAKLGRHQRIFCCIFRRQDLFLLPFVVCGFTTRGFLVVSSFTGHFATLVCQQFEKLYSHHNEGSRCIIFFDSCLCWLQYYYVDSSYWCERTRFRNAKLGEIEEIYSKFPVVTTWLYCLALKQTIVAQFNGCLSRLNWCMSVSLCTDSKHKFTGFVQFGRPIVAYQLAIVIPFPSAKACFLKVLLLRSSKLIYICFIIYAVDMLFNFLYCIVYIKCHTSELCRMKFEIKLQLRKFTFC